MNCVPCFLWLPPTASKPMRISVRWWCIVMSCFWLILLSSFWNEIESQHLICIIRLPFINRHLAFDWPFFCRQKNRKMCRCICRYIVGLMMYAVGLFWAPLVILGIALSLLKRGPLGFLGLFWRNRHEQHPEGKQ